MFEAAKAQGQSLHLYKFPVCQGVGVTKWLMMFRHSTNSIEPENVFFFPNCCLLSSQLTNRQKWKGSSDHSTSQHLLGGEVISACLWKRSFQGALPSTQVLTSEGAENSLLELLFLHWGAYSYGDSKWKELSKCWALPLITYYRPGRKISILLSWIFLDGKTAIVKFPYLTNSLGRSSYSTVQVVLCSSPSFIFKLSSGML